jgi:hypothetical protein
MPLAVLLLTLLVLPSPQAGAPVLTVVSASRSEVSLSWTAAGGPRFALERKPLGASWGPPPPNTPPVVVTTMVDGTSTKDSAIDAMGTYVYLVRPSGAAGQPGAPSNEVTVGPPPVGFTQVTKLDPGVRDPGQFAPTVAAAEDANGDPVAIYTIIDPDNNQDDSDSTLHFVSWNRAKYTWNAPTLVGRTGRIDSYSPQGGLAFAADTSTHALAIAYATSRAIKMSLSDDGKAWREIVVATGDPGSLAEPSLALDGGRIFLVYFDSSEGLVFRSGRGDEAPEKWPSTKVPPLPNTSQFRQAGFQIALDGAHQPAVASWLPDDEKSYTVALSFWRPGQPAAVRVTDTGGHQSDFTDVRLTFAGTQPAMVFGAYRTDDDSHFVWYVKSSDSGATWGAPVAIPNDGGQTHGSPMSIVLNAQGRPFISAQVSGGNTTGTKCGLPKLSKSADGVGWTTCAPDTKGTPTNSASSSTVLLASNGKLYLLFRTHEDGGPLKQGILLWRER